MKIRYLEINNFRGIKSLKTTITGDFVCLIGSGDSCKSTILSAINYTLSPKWNINFDDSDFFNQDITSPISIFITLCEWDKTKPSIRKLFSENKFGQYIGGFKNGVVHSEPEETLTDCLTINLIVDKSLEPEWFVVKGDDKIPISASDRSLIGVGKIDTYLDHNFSLAQNTLLTRLSSDPEDDLDNVLVEAARLTKDNLQLSCYQDILDDIKTDSGVLGVYLDPLSTKIDPQRLALNSGILALHQEKIPLRGLGAGSKKLISCAMQMRLNNSNNILLIDELEVGLEPHRIRGFIKKLKESSQQVIITSHSPVVLRELDVSEKELCVCQRNRDGIVNLKCLSEIPEIQGAVRSNAEAFLGRRIIVCEGPTEIGCLRALDDYKKDQGDIPVWTLNTAYFNAGGIGNVKTVALKLVELGYQVAVFCDNDTPNQFTDEDKTSLEAINIKVICWEEDNSIEVQLFKDINWTNLPDLLKKIASIKDKDISSIIQSVTSKVTSLSEDYQNWSESADLRKYLGLVSGGKNLDGTKNDNTWFKRIDLAEGVFSYVIPNLPPDSIMQQKLDELWEWIQGD